MKKETMKCRKEIRLYSWELEELQKQAEKMGLSDSQYLRMLITNPGITRKSARNWNA